MFILQQAYEVPQNFKRLLGPKLRRLVLQGKLERVSDLFLSLSHLIVNICMLIYLSRKKTDIHTFNWILLKGTNLLPSIGCCFLVY